MQWFVVNPIKALTDVFVVGIVKATNPKKGARYILNSRHHPVAFNEVLEIFNTYGLILPVTMHMARTMKRVCNLLRLNTSSKRALQEFYKGKEGGDDQYEAIVNKKIENKKMECFFFDEDPEETPFSNVGMVVAIVLCLLAGNIGQHPNNKKQYQSIVRLNLQGYGELFKKGKDNYGISGDLETQQDRQDYGDLLRMNFAHPADKKKEGGTFKYSLVEVIYGLFYDADRKEDYTLPNTDGHGFRKINKPMWRVTEKERANINQFLVDNFSVGEHYYCNIGEGNLSKLIPYEARKEPPSRPADTSASKGNSKKSDKETPSQQAPDAAAKSQKKKKNSKEPPLNTKNPPGNSAASRRRDAHESDPVGDNSAQGDGSAPQLKDGEQEGDPSEVASVDTMEVESDPGDPFPDTASNNSNTALEVGTGMDAGGEGDLDQGGDPAADDDTDESARKIEYDAYTLDEFDEEYTLGDITVEVQNHIAYVQSLLLLRYAFSRAAYEVYDEPSLLETDVVLAAGGKNKKFIFDCIAEDSCNKQSPNYQTNVGLLRVIKAMAVDHSRTPEYVDANITDLEERAMQYYKKSRVMETFLQ